MQQEPCQALEKNSFWRSWGYISWCVAIFIIWV